MTLARVTTADLEQMPVKEGWRYEIIDGELYVSTQPSWQHQYICLQVGAALLAWDRAANRGVVIPAPGVIFAEDNNVAPDVVWISHQRFAAVQGPGGHLYGAPDLVVEVLSPGRFNQMRDREAKLDLYRRQDVHEYWLIDGDARTVEVYRRTGDGFAHSEQLTETGTLTSPLLPGFSCSIASLIPPASLPAG